MILESIKSLSALKCLHGDSLSSSLVNTSSPRVAESVVVSLISPLLQDSLLKLNIRIGNQGAFPFTFTSGESGWRAGRGAGGDFEVLGWHGLELWLSPSAVVARRSDAAAHDVPEESGGFVSRWHVRAQSECLTAG